MRLKPCPFCDGEANIEFYEILPSFCVECCECEAQTKDTKTEKEAIELWNKRA